MLGIVAHTARSDEAHELMGIVGAVYMSVDNGTHGCERNHLRTWRWLKEHTKDDWVVVLEDDAKPIPRFAQHLDEALKHSPTPIVSLYRGHNVNNPAAEKAGLQATERANEQDASWVTCHLLLHAVAVAVKTELLPDMIAHIEALRGDLPIDEAISHYATRNRVLIGYTHGSLVDHADTPSVIVRHRDKLPRPPGRVAYQLGAPTEWTDKAVKL